MIRLNEDLLSVEDFLKLPEIHPPLEYFGGRAIQKVSPNRPHGLIQITFGAHLLRFAREAKLGMIYSELRCSYGGDSFIPDLCFIAKGRIPRNQKGELATKIRFAPDLAIEILSPGQTIRELSAKIRFGLKHGLRLGWIIHPLKKQIYVLRPGSRMRLLKVGETLSGEEILPGYELNVEELFCWQDED